MFEMPSHSRVLQQKIKVKQHASVCIDFSVAVLTHYVVWRRIPPCGAEFLRVAPNSSVWHRIPPFGTEFLRVAPNSSVWRPIPSCGAEFLRVAPNSCDVTGDNSPAAATNDQYGSEDRDPVGDFHRGRSSGAAH